MTDANTVPPGWYDDTNLPGTQRWWDGAAWTEHTHTPAATPAPYGSPQQQYLPAAIGTAPAGTKTGTVWIWVIVVLPLLSLITIFSVDWKDYIDSSVGGSLSGNPTSSLGIYSSPGYLISSALGWVLYGITVVFAALDVRELKRRGVPVPFHWAFAFLTSLVYVIGRSVVVRRRTGGGLAPLWVYIGVYVINIIAGIVLTVLLFQYIAQVIPFS